MSWPALVADDLFVDVLLGANWLKAVGACLDMGQLELVVDSEKLKLKKLPSLSNTFWGQVLRCTPVKWLRFQLVPLFCLA